MSAFCTSLNPYNTTATNKLIKTKLIDNMNKEKNPYAKFGLPQPIAPYNLISSYVGLFMQKKSSWFCLESENIISYHPSPVIHLIRVINALGNVWKLMNSPSAPLILVLAKKVIPTVENMKSMTIMRLPTLTKLGMVCKNELKIWYRLFAVLNRRSTLPTLKIRITLKNYVSDL